MAMPAAYDNLVRVTTQQGNQFNTPISPKGGYYAFLSMCILNDTTLQWSVLFELLPSEWVENEYQTGSEIVAIAPRSGPASWYYLDDVPGEALQNMMGVKDASDLAEGSWYLINMQQGQTGQLYGEFYSPDLVKNPRDETLFYGIYELTQAKLILLPDLDANGDMILTVVDNEYSTPKIKTAISERYFPFAEQYSSERSKLNAGQRLLVNPPYSIGVMDVGIAACNLIFSQDEPFAYFDVGYPIRRYENTVSDNFDFDVYDPQTAPIATADMTIILSHWHYDHWGLAMMVDDFKNLRWLLPWQTIGPVAVNFKNTLGRQFYPRPQIVNVPGTPIPFGMTQIYLCRPPGTNRAMYLNNSGLALKTPVPLGANQENVLMTADANFDSVGRGTGVINTFAPVGLQAVHHGSSNNNATAFIPTPKPGFADPFVVYSYGAWVDGAQALQYAYGFPTYNAAYNTVMSYNAGGWTEQFSTAQWDHIRNTVDLAARGNIIIGTAPPPNAAYDDSMFYTFRYTINYP